MFLKVVICDMLLLSIITLRLTFVSSQFLYSPPDYTSTISTSGQSPGNANGFVSSYQPGTASQQFTSSSFTNAANGNTFISSVSGSSPTVAASSSNAFFNYNRGIPNAFTTASLAIPSIQRFSQHKIPGYHAADLLFRVANKRSTENGNPNHDIFANLIAQNIAGIDYFSIPLYFQVRGNVIEKFLLAEGVEITPDLPQRYADSFENTLSSRVIDSPEALHRAIFDGYSSFIDSVDFGDKGYILSLYLNNEFALFRNI